MQKSVASLFEMHMRRGDPAASTVASKGRALKCFLDFFGDMHPQKVGVPIAEDYQEFLLNGRAATTVNCYVQHFRTFFTWLHNRNEVPANPFRTLARITEDKVVKETFSHEEIDRMAEMADDRWLFLLCLGLLGLRRGEALNLVGDDLDFDEGFLRIRSKRLTASTWDWRIKGRRERIISFPRCMAVGSGVIELHSLARRLAKERGPGQPYICVKPAYYLIQLGRLRTMDYQKKLCPWGNFRRDFRKLQKRAAVTPLKTFHELRAACATVLIDQCGLID